MIERADRLQIGPVQGVKKGTDQIKGIRYLHHSIEGSLDRYIALD
jgi:hypothetical protein